MCLYVRTMRSKRTDRRSLNAQILVMAIHVFNSQLFLVHAAMISITVSVEFILNFWEFFHSITAAMSPIYAANKQVREAFQSSRWYSRVRNSRFSVLKH